MTIIHGVTFCKYLSIFLLIFVVLKFLLFICVVMWLCKNYAKNGKIVKSLTKVYIYILGWGWGGGEVQGLGDGNLYEHTNLQCLVKMFLDRVSSCNIRLIGNNSTFLLQATDITPFYLFFIALIWHKPLTQCMEEVEFLFELLIDSWVTNCCMLCS